MTKYGMWSSVVPPSSSRVIPLALALKPLPHQRRHHPAIDELDRDLLLEFPVRSLRAVHGTHAPARDVLHQPVRADAAADHRRLVQPAALRADIRAEEPLRPRLRLQQAINLISDALIPARAGQVTGACVGRHGERGVKELLDLLPAAWLV
ncbi:MAG: hypothetical protein ACYSU2_14875 [Planctomycetota bacterium]|jgi:hypothetical protein